MTRPDHILVFTHPPEPDASRTRWTLCHRIAAGRAVLLGRHHAAMHGAQLRILHRRCCGASERRWLGAGSELAPQPSGNWGLRLRAAMEDAFDRGAQRVVVLAPRRQMLPAGALAKSFTALESLHVVWEPDRTGGCPLFGLRRTARELLAQVDWSHEPPLHALMHAMRKEGMMLLPGGGAGGDEDVPQGEAMVSEASGGGVTVVIPVLNEAAGIRGTIATVREEADEIIVVDGGSGDNTAALAEASGVMVLRTPPGRAVQMNAGALAARHRHLLFLHADTVPPAGFAWLVRRALADRSVAAGAFSLSIQGTSPALRWVEWGANLRSRHRQLPYGDQGVFTTVRTFEASGGFAPLPFMEDYDWARRVRKLGKVVTLPEAALTSERRWRKLGPWRTTLLNQCVIAAFRLGVNPARLSRWYAAAGRPGSGTFVGNKRTPGVSHA